jgi:translation initiation factor 2 subunit 1
VGQAIPGDRGGEHHASLRHHRGAPDGVEHLKRALTAPAAQEEETTLEISSDGAPDYRIRVRAPDFKQAERELKAATDAVLKGFKPSGGEASFERL